MSASYPDLTNAFPDVASDERYLYRDVTIDDVPFITQYENLYNAVRTAHDASSRQTAWEALEAFKKITSKRKVDVSHISIRCASQHEMVTGGNLQQEMING